MSAELSELVERLTHVRRLVISLMLVGSIVVACEDADQSAVIPSDKKGATTTSNGDATCASPPDTELDVDSPLDLTVEPNPVAAGVQATLSVERGDLPVDSWTGAGAAWQCWDEAAWVDTHQIVRNGFHRPGVEGEAIEVEPGVDTTIPAIGLPVPSSYPIVIPDVAPGTYRIVDTASYRGGTVMGFVIVEVIED